MPKISTHRIQFEKDHLNLNIPVDVIYKSGFGFYIEVPADYTEAFDTLSEEEMKLHCAQKMYKYKYMKSGDHKNVVVSNNEVEVIEKAEQLIEKLVSIAIKKEPVIIVSFKVESPQKATHTDTWGYTLQPAGINLRAMYCTKIVAGGQAAYYKYSHGLDGGCRSEQRPQSNDLVIPDTPGNRAFIEELHKTIILVGSKLKQFMATPDALMEAIANNQKLLSA